MCIENLNFYLALSGLRWRKIQIIRKTSFGSGYLDHLVGMDYKKKRENDGSFSRWSGGPRGAKIPRM